MNASQKLAAKNAEGKIICVGLDADINKIPDSLRTLSNPILEFNKRIISATVQQAAAYKINFAFYEKFGSKGFDIIEQTIKLIPEDILIIADAKRGDIGNTSEMYARSVFDYFKCDAITVSPYMGFDSVQPFLKNASKLVFILALTSNPGSEDFEKLMLKDGSMVFQQVIKKALLWNENKNIGLVFGATKIDELKDNISLLGDLPVLLPGVGAQGAKLEDVTGIFNSAGRLNLLVNVSRGIIYKSSKDDFDSAAGVELKKMNQIVKNLLIM